MFFRGLTAAIPLLLFAVGGPLSADPLWTRLIPGRSVESDPARDYMMTQDNGPWMVMATTFSGEGAREQAHELVLELRRRYKLEAYLHEMEFDFSKGTVGRGVDGTGQPLRMRYQRDRPINEIAVLVGNYATVDDPEGQKTLRKIKYMRPDAIGSDRKRTTQTLAALRTIQSALLPDDDERKQRGPMGKAFVTRNPMLPKEFFVPKGIDRLVVKMNKGVEHNLLDCPGKYTVKVATFTGTVVLDQRKIAEYESGKKMKSRLADAADKAHKLTLALRSKGYDAYEFHDRYASMVTVGSFNSTGVPRQDGKTEINPRIHAIMQTFAAEQAPAGRQTGYKPKVIAGVPCDLQPQIVQIPQRSISSDYGR